MPVRVNYPAFTDEDILFETMEDANDFFNQVTVPNATEVSYGVVKKGAAVTADFADIAAPFALTNIRVQALRDDGAYDYIQVPKKADTEDAVNDLRTALISLKNSLVAAGLLGS